MYLGTVHTFSFNPLSSPMRPTRTSTPEIPVYLVLGTAWTWGLLKTIQCVARLRTTGITPNPLARYSLVIGITYGAGLEPSPTKLESLEARAWDSVC